MVQVNGQIRRSTRHYVFMWTGNNGDEPPHQIHSYTLLFSLFLYFLYIINPPLCTLTACDHARTRLFDGHMIYDSHVFTSILSISNVCPSTVWPIMSPCTMRSGTYYNFTSDEPYACFLVFHSYLTCLYLPFAPYKSQPIAYTSFPQNSELALTPCITPHLPHTISHHTTLPHNSTVFTIYHTWRWSHTPRLHPQSPIGFILRSPAL